MQLQIRNSHPEASNKFLQEYQAEPFPQMLLVNGLLVFWGKLWETGELHHGFLSC